MSSRQARRAATLIIGSLLAISLIWLGGGRAHVVAQTATPGAENQTIAPEIATSQPESQTLSAETAQATAETESLSGDDGLDISAGIIAGVAAAAAILLAGIAYRIVRGRPRAE